VELIREIPLSGLEVDDVDVDPGLEHRSRGALQWSSLAIEFVGAREDYLGTDLDNVANRNGSEWQADGDSERQKPFRRMTAYRTISRQIQGRWLNWFSIWFVGRELGREGWVGVEGMGSSEGDNLLKLTSSTATMVGAPFLPEVGSAGAEAQKQLAVWWCNV